MEQIPEESREQAHDGSKQDFPDAAEDPANDDDYTNRLMVKPKMMRNKMIPQNFRTWQMF